jgi:hypothetical protein
VNVVFNATDVAGAIGAIDVGVVGEVLILAVIDAVVVVVVDDDDNDGRSVVVDVVVVIAPISAIAVVFLS